MVAGLNCLLWVYVWADSVFFHLFAKGMNLIPVPTHFSAVGGAHTAMDPRKHQVCIKEGVQGRLPVPGVLADKSPITAALALC